MASGAPYADGMGNSPRQSACQQGAGDIVKIVLHIPHGGAARNFLLTSFIAQLTANAEVAVLSNNAARIERELGSVIGRNIHWQPAPVLQEGASGYLTRRIFLLAHMRVCNTLGMQHMLKYYRPRGGGAQRLADEMAWHYSRWVRDHAALESLTTKYVNNQAKRPTSAAYLKYFREFKPDVVFCTDQRPPEVAAITAAARRLNIPVGTFLFSWDNLSSKGRMPATFDFYCVWSDLMKEELLRFYPGIAASTVHVTGTPQFELYESDRFHLSRADFCEMLGADPNRPIICFSGEDVLTDPENPEHLAAVLEHVENGRIDGQPQVVVRPSPTDLSDRWQQVREQYKPHIIWSPPRWDREPNGSWTTALPTVEDQQLLCNLIRHSKCGINMVSTMTLDFAVGNKPTINVAFDVGEPPHGKPTWEHQFQWDHYRSVVDLNAAHFAHSADELAEKINLACTEPEANAEGRRKFVTLQTNDHIGDAANRLCEVLAGQTGS